jgi:hypothetical protein
VLAARYQPNRPFPGAYNASYPGINDPSGAAYILPLPPSDCAELRIFRGRDWPAVDDWLIAVRALMRELVAVVHDKKCQTNGSGQPRSQSPFNPSLRTREARCVAVAAWHGHCAVQASALHCPSFTRANRAALDYS